MVVINGAKQSEGGGNAILWSTTLGSSTDTIDVPSAVLGENDYIVDIQAKGAGASGAQFSIFVNDDYTEANYETQVFNAADTTLAGSRASNARQGWLLSGGTVGLFNVRLVATNDELFYYATTVREASGGVVLVADARTHYDASTVSSIDEIRIFGHVANFFASGTFIQVVRPFA
jgi:hypothetical protein